MAKALSIDQMHHLLLMAAAVHGYVFGTRDNRANCAKVIGQALLWSGLTDEEVREAMRDSDDCPALDRLYAALIGMIRHEPKSEALFEGAGNFGTAKHPPAYPNYTACWLTDRGTQAAERLLKQHPEYRKSDLRCNG